MATKLNWEYHDGEYRAEYKNLVICAVRDEHPSNPFEEWDGHWPMLSYYDRTLNDTVEGLGDVLGRFTDAQIIHDQKAIDAILGAGPFHDGETDELVKWVRDPVWLREAFDEALGHTEGTKRLDALAELLDLLGIPNLRTSSHGYCQGDYTELLIVATPEAVKELRPDVTPDELRKDMENQAGLYGAWAWGDVYGYVVCAKVPGEDEDDEPELEEIEDGSCWGYYGSEFDESGLEDAAIEAADHYLKQQEKVDA